MAVGACAFLGTVIYTFDEAGAVRLSLCCSEITADTVRLVVADWTGYRTFDEGTTGSEEIVVFQEAQTEG